MDSEHAFYYTREVMAVLRREFASPDEEMKKIVLKVVLWGAALCAVCCVCVGGGACVWAGGSCSR